MSGIECNKSKKLKYFDSEALMFELVLSIAAYGLCESNLGCDLSVSGDFVQALKKFTKVSQTKSAHRIKFRGCMQ